MEVSRRAKQLSSVSSSSAGPLVHLERVSGLVDVGAHRTDVAAGLDVARLDVVHEVPPVLVLLPARAEVEPSRRIPADEVRDQQVQLRV